MGEEIWEEVRREYHDGNGVTRQPLNSQGHGGLVAGKMPHLEITHKWYCDLLIMESLLCAREGQRSCQRA